MSFPVVDGEEIWEYATSAEPIWNQLAWGGMLVLITMVLVLNIMVRVASGPGTECGEILCNSEL